MRLKSIKNIGKITRSMKMIASTKLNRAQKTMEVGRNYVEASSEALKQLFDDDAERSNLNLDKQQVLIVCSSDKGLCGAVHSSLSKLARKSIKEKSESTSVVVLGDKAKPQIAREARMNIKLVVNQVGRDAPTFSEALAVVNSIMKESLSACRYSVLFNKFKSVIAYENCKKIVPTLEELESAKCRPKYEIKPEIINNYLEWVLANVIFQGFIEGYASEMAARRMAMENATKNSEEIVDNLTMQYNRTRQAVITNELVDIITGASAL